jgi:hypothetical protein
MSPVDAQRLFALLFASRGSWVRVPSSPPLKVQVTALQAASGAAFFFVSAAPSRVYRACGAVQVRSAE